MRKFEILSECEFEFWRTQDGRRIAIPDMTNEHLRNTLTMLVRNGRHQHRSVEHLWLELLRRKLNYDTTSPYEFSQKFEHMKQSHNYKTKKERYSSTFNMIKGT